MNSDLILGLLTRVILQFLKSCFLMDIKNYNFEKNECQKLSYVKKNNKRIELKYFRFFKKFIKMLKMCG